MHRGFYAERIIISRYGGEPLVFENVYEYSENKEAITIRQITPHKETITVIYKQSIKMWTIEK